MELRARFRDLRERRGVQGRKDADAGSLDDERLLPRTQGLVGVGLVEEPYDEPPGLIPPPGSPVERLDVEGEEKVLVGRVAGHVLDEALGGEIRVDEERAPDPRRVVADDAAREAHCRRPPVLVGVPDDRCVERGGDEPRGIREGYFRGDGDGERGERGGVDERRGGVRDRRILASHKHVVEIPQEPRPRWFHVPPVPRWRYLAARAFLQRRMGGVQKISRYPIFFLLTRAPASQ